MQHVKLVAVTTPTIPEITTAEEFVAYVARVSNPSNQLNTETSSKLIRYLIKNKHWSPFEMVSVCMEITTTRDIARQILRHRSFSFQEFSQRYADPTQSLEFVTREPRLQDTKNRQNSLPVDPLNDKHRILSYHWEQFQNNLTKTVLETYKWALENNIAKEQARAILPEGLIESRLYMSGSLRSWLHYIQVRTDISTQKEHRIIADLCKSEISKEFPSIQEALDSL